MKDLTKLIDEKYKTRKDFAKAVGMSEQTLSKKLKGSVRWSIIEVWQVVDLLDIPDNEVRSYFFDRAVAIKAAEATRRGQNVLRPPCY